MNLSKAKAILRKTLRNNNSRYIPATVYPDDLFLVSFPKSGNTWMRFILANLLKGDSEETIDFHTTIKYVPEVGVHQEEVDALDRPRVLKSHAAYMKAYPKVIYIVRDARDVYVSYYHYLRKSLPEGMSFSSFLRKEDMRPCRWHEHVSSWIDQPNVYVARYEDLLADTFTEVNRIVEYWGAYNFSDTEIKRAIEASDFKSMQQLEAKSGRPFKTENEKHIKTETFMRKGAAGDWVNYFDDEDYAFLLSEAQDLFLRFGYTSAE